MKKLILCTVLLLSACSTVVPVKHQLPSLPDELTKACKPLAIIEGQTTTLSVLMDTVAKNYGSRHECAAQLDAILEWYASQQKIFDEANK